MAAESRLVKRWRTIYQGCRKDIFALCRYLNFLPTDQQAHILRLVQLERDLPIKQRKKRIAVKSGQGPGKTAISNIIALWRVLQFPDAMCIITAPTMRQAKKVWLAEFRRLIRQAHPILKKMIQVTKSDVRLGGYDHPEWGIQLATGSKAENVQGFHEKHLTFIVDEASGVERDIIDTIKATLSNPDSLMIMIGNPNTRDCSFFDCFTRFHKEWHLFTMNAEESPITDKDNIRKLEEEFGRDSDVYRVRVLGEFPYMDPNCVMSSEDLWRCAENDPIAAVRRALKVFRFGIDLARYGDAESVIYKRSGLAVIENKIFVKTDPNDVIDMAFEMQRKNDWKNSECTYIVDAGGMGQGVLRSFHKSGRQVLEFHTGGTPRDSQYANKMTEAFFHVAKLSREGYMFLPNDYRLIQQLSSRLYFINKKGKIILETKEEYVKRGYESPDRADAFVMCFYPHVKVGGTLITQKGSCKTVGMEIK